MRPETACGDSSLSHSAPGFVLRSQYENFCFCLPVMSEPVVGLGKNLVKSGNYPNLTLTKKVIQKIPFY